jgi:hypothetical protein
MLEADFPVSEASIFPRHDAQTMLLMAAGGIMHGSHEYSDQIIRPFPKLTEQRHCHRLRAVGPTVPIRQ